MKLAIGYPWASPFVFTQFMDSTINMQKPEGYEVRYFRGKGWCSAKRHIACCQQALDWGADLICIIGADQVHPEDMLCKLVKRFEQGYEVVTALIPCRGYVHWQPMVPFQPMAWRFKTNDEMGDMKYRTYVSMKESGDMVHVIDRSDGEMVECNFIGSGVLMFHRDHLLALKKPWFYETVDRETQTRTANMDCVFVWRLQAEAGANIWIDTTIIVKHLNVFEIDDTFSDRFKDWTIPGKGDPTICNF